ncbi:MAG: 1-(5-phosphoribosyl)-5-[(5-phosphoribosylamino)methylideneamino]imidazole-4-carboxamide isomerase [Chloroflexi bacterium]|nr:1-(5-phosphoribosyl)-5-[(5-phosphoribosylamino)methylideneamino]imidazole-4-carboxamide isomerase [Chloroflexota bacterium]
MEVIPAIDLRGGRCVRLYQGDFDRETVYSEDPLAVARQWQEQGASRLHLVDLDGAAQGNPVNLDIIAAIVAQSEIPVQVGGGVRSSATAEKLLSIGVERVVIGTAAVRDPDLVRQLCQDGGSPSVVVAVDARDGLVAVQGWLEKTSVTAVELGKRMAALGVERLLYTDISRDGTLSEPNFSANAELVESTGLAILASGGVASLDHITELAKIGAEGVIVGRALYTGDLELSAAIAAGLAGS